LGGDEFLEFAAWALRRDAPARRRRTSAAAGGSSGPGAEDFVLEARITKLLPF